MKISPIAKYITENKITAVKVSSEIARLYDVAGSYVGFIRHTHTPDSSTININLYKPEKCHEHPSLQQVIKVERTMRYFLSEKKALPVKIDIERTITDYDNRTVKTDKIGHGLKQDRYISEISETDKALKSARENSDIQNEPVYEINKLPFKYEFKYHMYYPSKRICEIPITVR